MPSSFFPAVFTLEDVHNALPPRTAPPNPTGKIIFLLQRSTNPAANSPCEPEWY